jgi:hypothetical protein
MKKVLIGILISIVFVYLTLRGVNTTEIWASLKNKEYMFLLPITALFLFTQFLRSIRWGIILSPIKAIDQRSLLPISFVGFMAIILAPMRVGEIVRPYLINRKESIPISSGIGTILVERTMDLVILFALFSMVLSQISLPDWAGKSTEILIGILAAELALIVFIFWAPHKLNHILDKISYVFPEKIARSVKGLINNLVHGFRVFAHGKKVIQVFILSLTIWTLSALAVLFLFHFYGLDLGMFAAFTVSVITALGISIPAGPGYIGNFQYACMVSLSLWSVSKTDAFVFSMFYYTLNIGVNILLGIIFLPFVDVSLKGIYTLKKKENDLPEKGFKE